jgi:DNA mismatch endonuclease (patch repair protein)
MANRSLDRAATARRSEYPAASSPAVAASMRANRRVGTKPEAALRSALQRRGLRFRKDFPVRVPGTTVRPDIVFTRAKVAVFVDGCFWHCCPQHGTRPATNRDYWDPKLDANVARDRTVTERLKLGGWTVLRVWEHVPVDEAAEAVAATLNSRTRDARDV